MPQEDRDEPLDETSVEPAEAEPSATEEAQEMQVNRMAGCARLGGWMLKAALAGLVVYLAYYFLRGK